MSERQWTKWSDGRPPNAPGRYRYRASFVLLGLPVAAEWAEDMHLCGMGYAESEWWPLRPCHWDGRRRTITNSTLEWSQVQADDPPSVVWHGFDLLPCPFTGEPPRVEAQGRYIGAPLWHSETVSIQSAFVRTTYWHDATAMVRAWNRRDVEAARAALEPDA